MRRFEVIYKPKSRFHNSERHLFIQVPNPTGDIGIDAKIALNIFINSVGSLKKNEIIEIQEYGENDEKIGEPIRPMAETAIVPDTRKHM